MNFKQRKIARPGPSARGQLLKRTFNKWMKDTQWIQIVRSVAHQPPENRENKQTNIHSTHRHWHTHTHKHRAKYELNWNEMKWNKTSICFHQVKLKVDRFYLSSFSLNSTKAEEKETFKKIKFKAVCSHYSKSLLIFFGAKFTLHKFIHSHQTGKWMGFSWEKCHQTEPFHIRSRARC